MGIENYKEQILLWLMTIWGDKAIPGVSVNQDFRLFPGESFSTEVTVCAGFLIDRLSQVQFPESNKQIYLGYLLRKFDYFVKL